MGTFGGCGSRPFSAASRRRKNGAWWQAVHIPLATYPAAIKAAAPLIDAGKTNEAKTALRTALNILVIERFIAPPPTLRATAMLGDALTRLREQFSWCMVTVP